MKFQSISIAPVDGRIAQVRLYYYGAFDEDEAREARRALGHAVKRVAPALPMNIAEARGERDFTWALEIRVHGPASGVDRLMAALRGIFGAIPPLRTGEDNPFTGARQRVLF